VTDANYKHTLSLVRMLAREGHEIYVLGRKKLNQAFHSKYVKGIICTNEQDITRIVDYAARRFSIDTFLPVNEQSTGDTVRRLKGLPKSVKTLLPSLDMFRTFSSKALTFKAMKQVIPEYIPKTFSPESLDEYRRIARQIPLPAVVKLEFGMGGSEGLRYCRNEQAVGEAVQEKLRFHQRPVIQEYVAGHGEGMFIVAKAGKIYAFYQHQRLAEYPVTGGPSVFAKSIYHRDLERIARRILDKYPWTGVAMFEFRRNLQGVPKLIEINAKFWGSLELAAHCNVNIPHIAVQLAHDEHVTIQRSYLLDVKQSWPIPYGIFYLFSSRRWSRLPQILFPNNVDRFTDISLRDPLPNLLQLQGLLVKPLRSVRQIGKGFKQ
jgi:predicted ATP-grasp superfamily ATP-dependent carboligase